MKILGMLGSFRANGNSDILAKEALMAAEGAGATVEIIRLTDYRIKPCQGYGLCLFREEGCHIKDDLKIIWSKIAEADGILLSVPCYFLEATAVIKQLIDRSWVLAHQGTYRGKYASYMITYGTRGWTSLATIQPNIWFGIMGFKVIHREMVHTQGLGEVVHENEALSNAQRVGLELCRAIQDQDPTYRSEPGLCPICQDWNIRVLKDRKNVECPTCGIRGNLVLRDGEIDVQFDQKAMAQYRFDPEVCYNHFTYHITPSRDYFMRTKDERKEKVKRYKEYRRSEG
jgi:multimeric flavodoxin WrbA